MKQRDCSIKVNKDIKITIQPVFIPRVRTEYSDSYRIIRLEIINNDLIFFRIKHLIKMFEQKADISAGLSSKAPLTAQCCNDWSSFQNE